MWIMLAPASRQRRASSIISSGLQGKYGLSVFVGIIPVIAALIIRSSILLSLYVLLNNFSRYANYLHIIRDIFGHNGACSDD